MTKAAVVILNGAGGSELQDIQTLVRALLHAHKDQSEGGLMAFPPLSEQPGESEEILEAYAAAYPDLQMQSSNLPLPADLYSLLARDGVGRLEVGSWPATTEGPLAFSSQLAAASEEPLVVLNWQTPPELTRAIRQHPDAKGRIRTLDLKPRQPAELLPDDSGRPASNSETLLESRGATDLEIARASSAAVRQPEGGPDPKDPMAARAVSADLESLDPVAAQQQFGSDPATPVPNASLRPAAPASGAVDGGARSGGTPVQPSLAKQAGEARSATDDSANSDLPVSPEPEPVRQHEGATPAKPQSPGDVQATPSKPGPEAEAPDQGQAAPAEPASDNAESGSRRPAEPQGSESTESASTEGHGEADRDLQDDGAAPPTTSGPEAADRAGSGMADLVYPARTTIGLDSESYPLPDTDGTFGAILELSDYLGANVEGTDVGEAETVLAEAFPVDELEPDVCQGALIEQSSPLPSPDEDVRAGADPPLLAEGDPPECPPVVWIHLDS